VLIYIPTATPGLDLADFDFRLYRETTRIADPAWALEEQSTPGTYVVSGLPEGSATARYTLTWERASVGSAFTWGGTGSPLGIIIPERQSGLAPDSATGLANFAIHLYKNGDDIGTSSLAIAELGTAGDYKLSGWPVEATGASWAVTWERNGVYNAPQWSESPAAGTLEDIFGYGELAEDAADLIAEAGQPLRLIQTSSGLDAAHRPTTPAAKAYYNVTGIQLRDADLPPQYLSEGVRTESYYLSARGVPSNLQSAGWEIERAGKTARLNRVEPLSPGGIPLLYLVQAAA